MMTCKLCGEPLVNKRSNAQYCCLDHKWKAKNQRIYTTNPETILARNRAYYARNAEAIKEKRKLYFKNNKAKFAESCIKRYDAKSKRTPDWLSEWDRFYIEEFYDLATRRELHVDHIIPLRGKLVSGLHVPANLQLLSPEENRRKGNRYDI